MKAPWRGVQKGPLTRFFIINTRWFGVYLHRIDRPDADRECHDHPWSFISIVLRGWYEEERRMRAGNRWFGWRDRFSIAYRHRTDAHRITTLGEHTWTLIIRGVDHRVWGFYLETDKPGWARWVPWQTFESVRGEAWRAPA